MRKAWRKRKREQAAAAANAQYMATTTTWNPRSSLSSESDFERRESNASFVSSDYSHRGSVVYAGGYGGWDGGSSRPGTSSSVASSTDGRFPMSAYATGMINPAPAIRRPSVPNQIGIPSHQSFKVDNTAPQPLINSAGSYTHPSQRLSTSSASSSSFPFQSLTSPMPMMSNSQGGPFAFQR